MGQRDFFQVYTVQEVVLHIMLVFLIEQVRHLLEAVFHALLLLTYLLIQILSLF